MEFNNFSENEDNNHDNFMDSNYPGGNCNPETSRYRFVSNFRWLYLMETIRNNKRMKLLVLFAVILILAIIIGLILVLLPLLLKFINYISQNGLHGIVDYVT